MGRFIRMLLRLRDRRCMDVIPRIADERRRHTMTEATARLEEATKAFSDTVTLNPERVRALLREVKSRE